MVMQFDSHNVWANYDHSFYRHQPQILLLFWLQWVLLLYASLVHCAFFRMAERGSVLFMTRDCLKQA